MINKIGLVPNAVPDYNSAKTNFTTKNERPLVGKLKPMEADRFVKTEPTTKTQPKRATTPPVKEVRKTPENSFYGLLGRFNRTQNRLGKLEVRIHNNSDLLEELQDGRAYLIKSANEQNLAEVKDVEKEITRAQREQLNLQNLRQKKEEYLTLLKTRMEEQLKATEIETLIRSKPKIQKVLMTLFSKGSYDAVEARKHSNLLLTGSFSEIIDGIKTINPNYYAGKRDETLLMKALSALIVNLKLKTPQRLEIIKAILNNPITNVDIADKHGHKALDHAVGHADGILDAIAQLRGQDRTLESLDIIEELAKRTEIAPNKYGKTVLDGVEDKRIADILLKYRPVETAPIIKAAVQKASQLSEKEREGIRHIPPRFVCGELVRVNTTGMPPQDIAQLPKGLIKKFAEGLKEVGLCYDLRMAIQTLSRTTFKNYTLTRISRSR